MKGMPVVPPIAFSTATRALARLSSSSRPVSIGKETSGRRQPRQARRPSSHGGAPATASGSV